MRKLDDAGIAFTITSGCPPLGMKMLIDALELTALIAAFNGAVFLRPDFSIIDQNLLPTAVAKRVVEIIESHDLDVWAVSEFLPFGNGFAERDSFASRDWFVHERHGSHVALEWTVKFPPTVVPSFENLQGKPTSD